MNGPAEEEEQSEVPKLYVVPDLPEEELTYSKREILEHQLSVQIREIELQIEMQELNLNLESSSYDFAFRDELKVLLRQLETKKMKLEQAPVKKKTWQDRVTMTLYRWSVKGRFED